jgi:DNA-binding beta-propeller fold protein YncE
LSSILRRVALVALCVVGAVVLVGAVVGLRMVFPATPKSTPALRFAGFVTLPKPSSGPLSVLDYLTLDGRDLFVTSESSGAVYRVRLPPGALPSPSAVEVLPGTPAAHGVAIDPASGLGFVSHSESNTVDVFDPKTLKVLKHIPVQDDVDGIFFEPDAKLIYAVHGDPRLATLIDPATQTVVGTIALGGKPEFAAYDPQTRLMYQNLEDRNAVAAVDLRKRAVVDTWSLEPCDGPTSMALDLTRRRMFVVCKTNAKLVVVDLGSHRVTASLPVGGGPDSVAYDPTLRRLYATGKSGVMTVVQQDGADSYRVLGNEPLHYGAHTLALDPTTQRLYVAYASLLIPPRLAVFDVSR